MALAIESPTAKIEKLISGRFPIIIVTAIVSPRARPRARKQAARIPGRAYGSTAVRIICQRVAPSASAPSRCKRGTARQTAAIREPVIKTSADIPPVLRKVLDDTPVGHLTPPEVTKQGVEMVALCGRKPTTIDSPKRKEMREKLYAQKYTTTSDNYLKEIRKAAMIEYRQTSAEDSSAEENSGKKPKGRRN